MTEIIDVGAVPSNHVNRRSRDFKVAAVADWMIGHTWEYIERRHGCSRVSVMKWVAARGCFKLERGPLPKHVRDVVRSKARSA